MNKTNKMNKSKGNAKPLSITVLDSPLRVSLGIDSILKSGQIDDRTEKGHLVSEVGEAQSLNIQTYCDSILSFYLRKPTNRKTPSFIFGSAILGDAYSAFTPKIFSLPAVGSYITINPWMAPLQSLFVGYYQYISYDVSYIIHIPSPLGTAIYLNVHAPELDESVVTRGVRWKPAASPSLVVTVPYSNDLSMVSMTGPPRAGQSGGSIKIGTIENNSSESLNDPLNVTVFCCVHNVKLTGHPLQIYTKTINYETTTAIEAPFLNFTPQTIPPPPVDTITWYSDSAEVNAEGGLTSEENSSLVSEVPNTVEVETRAPTPATVTKNVTKSKNNTAHLNTKWVDLSTITLDASKIGEFQTLIINPYTIYTKGESFNLPWKRNLWTTGKRYNGFVHTVYVQFNVSRPPQISGVIEVFDANINSHRYFIQFGSKVEIPLTPAKFHGVKYTDIRPRNWLNPWLRTDEAKCELKYRLIGINRTADAADVKVRIAIKAGNSIFSHPIKPRKAAPTEITEMFENYLSLNCNDLDTINFYSDEVFVDEIPNDKFLDPQNFITSAVGVKPEEENVNYSEGSEENLDLDEFPVFIEKELIKNEIMAIPLNLPSLVDTEGSDDNAITQKFMRFAHVVPKGAGAMGPVVGTYTVHSRLPTNIAGSLHHVCIPGDVNDEVAIVFFGLASILGIAGSALSSIGGPLLNGIVNTGTSMLSNALGGIGGNLLGSLLGNNTSTVSPPQPEQPTQPTNAITGEIPISRFVEFLKPVLENYTQDPVFPTLLMSIKDLVNGNGEPLEKLPIRVLLNMLNTKVSREIFSRETSPQTIFKDIDVIIPMDRISNVLTAFYTKPETLIEGTKQNLYFKSFITLLMNKMDTKTLNKGIGIFEVQSTTFDDTKTAKDISDIFIAKLQK